MPGRKRNLAATVDDEAVSLLADTDPLLLLYSPPPHVATQNVPNGQGIPSTLPASRGPRKRKTTTRGGSVEVFTGEIGDDYGTLGLTSMSSSDVLEEVGTMEPRKKAKSGTGCRNPDGCDKSAQSGTQLCILHGGGHRCTHPDGCAKSAVAGTDLCVKHGGGHRCRNPDGCDKSAQSGTQLCILHGGGHRCTHPDGCDNSAQGGTKFCFRHGGGMRCTHPDGCDKISRGRTHLCALHGGGHRCMHPDGCDKGARGRSQLCFRHGGGKRCTHPDGCDKASYLKGLCTTHGGKKPVSGAKGRKRAAGEVEEAAAVVSSEDMLELDGPSASAIFDAARMRDGGGRAIKKTRKLTEAEEAEEEE